MKLEIYNYVGGMTTHAYPYRAETNVGGLGEHGTCHPFRFLSMRTYLPYFFFYFILGIAPSSHWWTDFDDLYVL